MTLRRQALALLLLVLLASSWGLGTTLVRMDLDELASAASIIVRARCLESESRWEGDEIWTFTAFEVVETMKGSPPKQMLVRLLGGRVGHFTSTVDGIPRFRPAEEVILFLEPTSAGDLSVTSWAQGTFRIRREPHTGRATVTQDTSGLAVFDPATRQFRPGGIRNLPLEEFRQRVLAVIERQESRRE